MDFATVLTSGVVAGVVAGFVTIWTTERKIAIENITLQRQLWRDKLRERALEVVKAHQEADKLKLLVLYVEFQLFLNPQDSDDQSILDTIWKMRDEKGDSNLSIELSEKLSLLLKHDWERAKREVKPLFFRGRKPKRISYANFKNSRIEKK